MKKFTDEIKKLVVRFRNDDVMALASMLSYSLLLSFFPFIIFLMTLAGYSNLKAEEVLSGIKEVLPETAYQLVSNTAIEIFGRKNAHLLSFSLIFTVFAASGGFNAVIKGLNKAYDELEERSFIKVQFVALCCTLGITLIIIITVLLLVFGEIIGTSMAARWNYSFMYVFLWNLLRYIVILFSLTIVFALLYKFTPSRRLTFLEVMPGTVFASAGWIIVSFGFAFYVNNFGSYSKAYGSIGAVIVLMTWLFLTSIIIILGGEINAVMAFEKKETDERFKKDTK